MISILELIFDKFPIINDQEFNFFNLLKKTTIFENLRFDNWVQAIHSASLVITPECGCTHVAAICKIYSKIIYDSDNQPHMIYKEYAPWQNLHERFIFNTNNLNYELTKKL